LGIAAEPGHIVLFCKQSKIVMTDRFVILKVPSQKAVIGLCRKTAAVVDGKMLGLQ
jgi:hypothetical protein